MALIRPNAFPPWLKPAVFALSLVPVGILVWRAFSGTLGVNPIEGMIRFLGDWALTFVLIALAVTPLRILTGWAAVMRLRRMLGLFAFFYAFLHVAAYVGLDQFFDWSAIGADIVKRVYITLGMASFVLLTLLALTSPKAVIRRLGGRRWQRLHQTVYVAAILGVVHYYLMVKADIRTPTLYAAVLAILLAIRLSVFLRRRRQTAMALQRE